MTDLLQSLHPANSKASCEPSSLASKLNVFSAAPLHLPKEFGRISGDLN